MFGAPALYKPTPNLKERVVGGRDAVGSVPYEYGRIARQQGADWKVRVMLANQRRQEVVLKASAGVNLEANAEARKMEFEQVTDRKALLSRIQHGVATGLKAAQHDLDRRRHRLRNLILEEESAWAREYVDKAQRADENKMEDFRKQAADIRAKREGENKALGEKKRLQQYKENSTQLRDMLTHRNVVASKEAQRHQMVERQWLRDQEREEDRMWFAVMMKNIEALKAAEEEDARQKHTRDLDVLATQRMQQEGQRQQRRERHLMRQEEMRANARALAELQEQLLADAAEKERKREQTRSDLLEQLRQKEEVLEKRRLEEQLVDETMLRLARDQLRREQETRQDLTEVHKRESKLYRDNVEELRAERAKADMELDSDVAKEMLKLQLRRDDMRAKIKEARMRLQKEVLAERRQQVQGKREARLAERRRLQDEHALAAQLLEQNLRLSELHNSERHRAQRRYGQDLMQQAEYNRLLKERERAEQERLHSACLQEEERYLALARAVVAASPEAGELHPFRAVMQGAVSSGGAAVAAAGEALCYLRQT